MIEIIVGASIARPSKTVQNQRTTNGRPYIMICYQRQHIRFAFCVLRFAFLSFQQNDKPEFTGRNLPLVNYGKMW